VSTVTANIVLGLDGSTAVNGSSSALSFPADRQRFHQIRKSADVIIIGGNTARMEPYGVTRIPLIILSRVAEMGTAIANSKATTWDLDIETALNKAQDQYQRILLEAGPSLLLPALAARRIHLLHVTLSESLVLPRFEPSRDSTRTRISLQELTVGYSEIERKVVPGGVFIDYVNAPPHE